MRNPFTPKIVRLQRDLVGQDDRQVRARLIGHLADLTETDRINPNPAAAQVLRAIAAAESGQPMAGVSRLAQAMYAYTHLLDARPHACGPDRAAALNDAYLHVVEDLGDQVAEGSVAMVAYAYGRA